DAHADAGSTGASDAAADRDAARIADADTDAGDAAASKGRRCDAQRQKRNARPEGGAKVGLRCGLRGGRWSFVACCGRDEGLHAKTLMESGAECEWRPTAPGRR